MRNLFFISLTFAFQVLSVSANTLEEAVESINANAIFMRHALAPGFGDPDHFNVSDCSTQRNLNDTGRSQAIDLGHILRDSPLQFTEIKSSFWCRCIDTAKLLNLGKVQTFEGLNSFYQQHADRQTTLNALNQYLDQLTVGVDLPVLVTHQVVISAVTGISAQSGGIVLYNSQTGRSTRWQPKR